jgi:ribosome-associated translation inhibitor RaiA
MAIEPEIHFHGLEKSEAVETRVREKVAKLQRHFTRMTSCRVVIDTPHRNTAKARMSRVKIEIGLPGRKPLIVTHEREGGQALDDLSLTLRDGFQASTRALDEVAAKIASRTKIDRGRRRPAPPRSAEAD